MFHPDRPNLNYLAPPLVIQAPAMAYPNGDLDMFDIEMSDAGMSDLMSGFTNSMYSGVDFGDFIDYSECTDTSSPSCTDGPYTPQSDPYTPRSDYSTYHNGSPVGIEDDVSALNLGGQPTPPFSPTLTYVSGVEPASGSDPNEPPVTDSNELFAPDSSELFILNEPFVAGWEPTNELLCTQALSAPALAAPVCFSPSPCPSDSEHSPQAARSPVRTSIGPIRRRRRTTSLTNAPRIYPCRFNNCKMSCRRSCDRTKHEKRHEKPFQCPSCDGRFSTLKDCQRHDLSKHRKSEHLLCTQCNHSTARKDNMADHVRRRHPDVSGQATATRRASPQLANGVDCL